MNIELPGMNQAFELRLYDLQGRLLIHQSHEAAPPKVRISNLNPGFYNLQLVGMDWISVKKIIVK